MHNFFFFNHKQKKSPSQVDFAKYFLYRLRKILGMRLLKKILEFFNPDRVYPSRKEKKLFSYMRKHHGDRIERGILMIQPDSDYQKNNEYLYSYHLKIRGNAYFIVRMDTKYKYLKMEKTKDNLNNLNTNDFSPFVKLLNQLWEEAERKATEKQIAEQSRKSLLLQEYLNAVD